MKRNKIQVGNVFGKLKVVEELGRIKYPVSNHIYYKVVCECGKEEIARSSLLRNGKKIMCQNCYIKISRKYKHGMTNTRIFNIWQSIKQRCNLTTCVAYKNYGGRGIKMCDEWLKDFNSFYKWAIANGYDENLSIDRIDNNKGYCPENCRWATSLQQNNNTRRNHYVEYNGEIHTIREWENILNFPKGCLMNRLRRKWSIERAFNTPLRGCQ